MQFSEDIRRKELNKKIALAGAGGVGLAALGTQAAQAQEVVAPANSPIDFMSTETAKVEGAITPVIAVAITSVVFLGGALLFKRFIMS